MRQAVLFEVGEQNNPKSFFQSGAGKLPGFKAPPELEKLFELSADAYYAAVHALMSELPITEEISRFIEKVGKARDRATAASIASDRGDPDVLAVVKTAYKVQHEIHRLTGFLRFSPDPNGVYIARCSPDHFILPALAPHFFLRFGETPWAIIDEKRKLTIRRLKNGEVRLEPESPEAENKKGDAWEDLWRLYHHSVNNEARKNLQLQRQFMPERYRKYLPESDHSGLFGL